MNLFQCAPHEIDRAWSDGASSLEEATKWAAREITPSQLKMLLARGERILIGARDETGIKGWAAVQVQQLPNIRILFVYAMSGKGICTAEGFDLLRKYAQSHGCSAIRGCVRPVMLRMLRQRFGANELYSTIEVPA